MLDGFHHHAILLEPIRYLTMKLFHTFGKIVLKLCMKELAEKRVILIPGAYRCNEKIGLLHLCQQPARLRRDHFPAKRQGELIRDGGV